MAEDVSDATWRWRGVALVLVVLLCCWAITTEITDPDWTSSGLTVAAGLVTYPGLLAGFLMLELHGRVSGTDVSPWLAVGIALIATQGLLLTVEVWRARSCCPAGWPLLADALLAVLLLVLVGLAAVPVRVDPGLAGLAGGFAIAALHLVVGWPRLSLSGGAMWAAVAVIVGAGMLLAMRLVQLTDLQPQAGPCLAFAVLALLGQRLAIDAFPAEEAVAAVGSAAGIVGAALACGVFHEMLREDVWRARLRTAEVNAELGSLRSEVRRHREQVHEVRAMVASISSAAALLHGESRLGDSSRRQLLEMLLPEMARLHRLLEHGAAQSEPFDLDWVVAPAVLARRASGQIVRWEPGGRWVVARRDDVAQVVRILLDNAAVHAPGATVTLVCSSSDGWVELSVEDDGPGIPPGLDEQIFTWGVRGEQSPGSGIGLDLARRLAEASSGYLHLGRRGGPGALFVVGLPEVGTTEEVRGR